MSQSLFDNAVCKRVRFISPIDSPLGSSVRTALRTQSVWESWIRCVCLSQCVWELPARTYPPWNSTSGRVGSCRAGCCSWRVCGESQSDRCVNFQTYSLPIISDWFTTQILVFFIFSSLLLQFYFKFATPTFFLSLLLQFYFKFTTNFFFKFTTPICFNFTTHCFLSFYYKGIFTIHINAIYMTHNKFSFIVNTRHATTQWSYHKGQTCRSQLDSSQFGWLLKTRFTVNVVRSWNIG